MALKKKETEEKKQVVRDEVEWFDAKKVFERKVQVTDEVTNYHLAYGVYLNLNSEKMRAQLDFMGACFWCRVVEGKNGYFLSMPSQKDKEGEWHDVVAVYDKGFHKLMKELFQLIAEN